MKKVLLVCVCTAMLASCGQNSADYKKLNQVVDSITLADLVDYERQRAGEYVI